MKVHCLYDQLVDIKSLQLNSKNRNAHPRDQIKRLAKILDANGWRYPVKVSKQSGIVVCGHGRIEAARENGWTQVPVNFQDYESPEKEFQDSIADNASALWSELDLAGINLDLADFGPFDIDLLGIENFVVEPADKLQSDENLYTQKIEAPIYTPKGERPSEDELFSREKCDELLQKIDASEAPEHVKNFLRHAAYRHVVFNYQSIADYYCHADKPTQELMEQSALVIIDFNKAIENGFVSMTKEIAEICGNDEQ